MAPFVFLFFWCEFFSKNSKTATLSSHRVWTKKFVGIYRKIFFEDFIPSRPRLRSSVVSVLISLISDTGAYGRFRWLTLFLCKRLWRPFKTVPKAHHGPCLAVFQGAMTCISYYKIQPSSNEEVWKENFLFWFELINFEFEENGNRQSRL